MKASHCLWRVSSKLLLGAALIASLLPSQPIRAASDDEPGFGNGSRQLDKSQVLIHEPFTLTYRLEPKGALNQREPVDLAMVLDVSGSMDYAVSPKDKTTRMESLRRSATKVTAQFREAGFHDRVGLVKFSTGGSIEQTLTTSYSQVDSKIRSLRADGYTNIDYGMTLGTKMLQSSNRTTRYMILLTDGYTNVYYRDPSNPNAPYNSKNLVYVRKDAIAESLRNADALAAMKIPVYSIALASGNVQDVDVDLLKAISSKTGGQFFQADNQGELDEAFRHIAETVQDPKMSSIVLSQSLPPGFVLADDDTSGAVLRNGLLTKNLPDIAYPLTEGSVRTFSVRLKYTGSTGSYPLEPAKVNYYVNGENGQFPIDTPLTVIVKDHALSMDGAVALRDSASSVDNWNMSDALPVQYTAEPVNRLIGGGTVTGIRVEHLLPLGVTVDEGLSDLTNGDTKLEADGRQRIVYELEDIRYNGSSFNWDKALRNVGYRFAWSGAFQFASEDMKITYKDNRGMTETKPLSNGLPPIEVKVHLEDQWHNTYVGEGSGKVRRSSWQGTPQWEVLQSASPVMQLAFLDAEHSSVRVKHYNGTENILNLLPSEPALTVLDAGGTAIVNNDWHKGPGTLDTGAATNRLPAGTVYLNEDFRSGYITGYEYRRNGGAWTAFAGAVPLNMTESGVAFESRAMTSVISGKPAEKLHRGSVSAQTVSLDSTRPNEPAYTAHFTDQLQVYRYEINPSGVFDEGSGLQRNGAGEEIFVILSEAGLEERRKEDPADYSFTATHADVTNGLLKLRLQDQVGNETIVPVNQLPEDLTGPTISLELIVDPGYVNATPAGQSDTRITNDDNPLIRITATENESSIHQIQAELWTSELVHQNINGTPGESTLQFRLADHVPGAARTGWYKLEIHVTNVSGTSSSATYYVKVNPGLEATVAASPDTPAANVPVLITIDDILSPVESRFGKPAPKLTGIQYAVTAAGAAPIDTDWKALKSTQFTLVKNGQHTVMIRLTDDDGMTRIPQPPLTIRIDYNQERY
jgi:Mg-chelatase subunit ChlD